MPQSMAESLALCQALLAEIKLSGLSERARYQIDSALNHVGDTLENFYRTRFGSETPLKITRWISPGHFDTQLPADLSYVYEAAGRALDKAYSSEILGGDVLFLAEDGIRYTVCVEAVISPADEAWANEIEEEARQNA